MANIFDNSGKNIGSLSNATSRDEQVTVNRVNGAFTTVTRRDLNTGRVSQETFLGDSPFGN